MLSSTHIIMAHYIYNYFQKEFNIKLNRTAFVLGNVKPDYHDVDIKLPHVIEESADSIVEYSRKIVEEDFSIKRFSYGLGVISHFICDYFCLYHRDEYKEKGWIKHWIYEFNLHLKFLKGLISDKIQVNHNPDLWETDILLILNIMNERYNNDNDTLCKDIKYALTAAITVAESIICLSIFNSNYSNTSIVNFGKYHETIGSAL